MSGRPSNPSPHEGDPAATKRGVGRRTFLQGIVGGASAYALGCAEGTDLGAAGRAALASGVVLEPGDPGVGVFIYLEQRGGFDLSAYRQILGAANEFKEGDAALGVAAADDASRQTARALLRATRLGDLVTHPVYEDELSRAIDAGVDHEVAGRLAPWSVGDLATFLLESAPEEIEEILPGLHSDVIGCVVKLMSNDELIAVSRKIFHPLPGSRVGAEGYLSARVQPNSPTDHPDDIVWQVFDAWSYGVGDLLLGTNPVSSEVESVAAVEKALQDVLHTFDLEDTLPHCVLAHIDVQAEVEALYPGSTELWFQSLAGVETANHTFDISVDTMLQHAASRTGRYGLYFETGQGADATNGHGHGFDMVLHETRKYGFARRLTREVAAAQDAAGAPPRPWVHVNDVAGFIGPEVFRTREQLVRCCLEDTVMGKLHGLTIGLDICSTLHMSVDLDDLDWCIEQIMPANPAYLMALPTKNDPMLSYLTTAFQDHVRVRETFGYRVDDSMWEFFRGLGVVGDDDRPGPAFGRPEQVYLAYRRRKGDGRPEAEILAEAEAQMKAVRDRGVFLASGHGEEIFDLEPELAQRVRYLYEDSKTCIFASLPDDFAGRFESTVQVRSQSKDRDDYILHPPSGELLDASSVAEIASLRTSRDASHDVQIVVSDGLSALALTDEDHLDPYLEALRGHLEEGGFRAAPEIILVSQGRVRAGYRIGEQLYGGRDTAAATPAVLHVIGERPGSGHHAFSTYITACPVALWSRAGEVDHNVTRVVSGIADTALDPAIAARQTVEILRDLTVS